jgi:phosphatidylglycerol:prolipoprotein diacylglycerol transferase
MTDPVAFHLGALAVRWYGIMVATGFLAGYLLIQRRAERYGVPRETAADLVFAALLGGIVGARLFYVIEFWDDEFRGHFLNIFRIYRGGLVFYGGFLGAVGLILFWGRRKNWPFRSLGDLAAPALPLGHALGRVGCFLNGCCFGRPWGGAAAVTYPGVTADGYLNGPLYVQRLKGIVDAHAITCEPVFPIQLVASAANAALCVLLLFLERRRCCEGRRFPLYIMLYAGTRMIVEFGRGDYTTSTAGLTPAQVLCLVLFPLGVAWFLIQGGKAETNTRKQDA